MTQQDPRPTDDETTSDAATPPSPPAGDPARPHDPAETTGTAEPTTAEAATAGDPGDVPTPTGAADTPIDPQQLFGSISLAAIEADIEAMMSDKMTELDGMLAGLEELVVRLEGEITRLEAPPDDDNPIA